MTTRTIVTAVSFRNTTTGLPDTRNTGWPVRLQFLFEGGGWQDYGRLEERVDDELKGRPDVIILEPRGGGVDRSNRSDEVFHNQDVLDEWLETRRRNSMLHEVPMILWLPSFPTNLRFDSEAFDQIWRGNNGYAEMSARLASLVGLSKNPVSPVQMPPALPRVGMGSDQKTPQTSLPRYMHRMPIRPGRG